jgi:hypothetical protein
MHSFTLLTGEKLFDDVCPMDGRSIPHDEQLAGNLAQQHAYKPHDVLGLVRSLLHLHEKPSFLGDTPNRGQMVARQLDAQHGSVPSQGIGADGHRQQIKTCFIDEN